MIAGFLVNRFRGDPALFAAGMEEIAARTGWQPLGLVPFFPDARRLPAEDALALDAPALPKPGAKIRVAVPLLPRIANFDDLDPLDAEPSVEVIRVRPGTPLPADAALVLLPGSKSTLADLADFRREGWDIDLLAHVRRGGRVLGLCGGYQMLGRSLADPEGVEGPPGSVPGLGLLDVETVLTGDKRLVAVTGMAGGVPFSGYEMHMGVTQGPGRVRPFADIDGAGPEGAISADGRIIGTYAHGLFADDRQRAHWLATLGAAPSGLDYEAGVEATLDALAAHLERHVDLDRLLEIAAG